MKDYIAGETKWRLPSQGDLPPTGAKCLILTTGGVCVVGAPLPRMHDEVRNALDSADIKQRMGT